VLLGREYACWLHSPSALGAENAPDVKTPPERETAAVIANPIVFRHLVYAIAFLVNRDVTHTAKHD